MAKLGRRHAGQPVLAAGIVGQRIVLDEKEHFRDGDGDHREIDAGAAQRDDADQRRRRSRPRPCRGSAPASRWRHNPWSEDRRRQSRRCRKTPPDRRTAGRYSRTRCRSRCRTGPIPGSCSRCSGATRRYGNSNRAAIKPSAVNPSIKKRRWRNMRRLDYSRLGRPNRPCGRSNSTKVMTANSMTSE